MSTTITPERRRQLAEQHEVDPQYLYQCLTGRKNMNPTSARRVEDATGGELTRKMLCQGTWSGIWPELADEQPTAKQGA